MSSGALDCHGIRAPTLFATAGAAGATLDANQLLKLDIQVSGVAAVALVDSGASHCFVSEQWVLGKEFTVDRSVSLQVKLANGEIKASSGVIRGVQLCISPGVNYLIDLWVVPLGFDIILGTPWLRAASPAIDWGCHRVIVVHNQQVITVYGRGGFPPPPERPSVEIVGAHKFSRDFSRAQYVAAYVGLVATAEPESGSDAACCSVHDTADDDTDQVPAKIKADLAQLLDEYTDIFESPGMPPEDRLEHHIDLIDESVRPPHHRVYRMSAVELDEVEKQVGEMLQKGWIRPSQSPYGAPILFAKKKDGGLRMCVDYRSLNRNTQVDRYPIPRVDELLDKLSGATVFSVMDCKDGFRQVRMSADASAKSAFVCS